jgi:transcriptional regulator
LDVAPKKMSLLQGTLDLLILKTLDARKMHGCGIAQRLSRTSRGVFDVNPGSLFPALHRMEKEGWIRGVWSLSENNRRARYYRLTPSGRKRLRAERRDWRLLSHAIGRVLEAS